MGIYEAIEKLVTISQQKLKNLQQLTAVCENIHVDINESDHDKLSGHTKERFDVEMVISQLDLAFYRVVKELEIEGIDSFDKIDSLVYPNIKKLKPIVSDILIIEEKLSAIKLKNNQFLSSAERAKDYKIGKATKAYSKQKQLNK